VYRKIEIFVLARLCEASTWQAIGFMLALCGSHYGADIDWGHGAALGGTISAIIKAAFPDPVDTK
jgi:hypothetical protein